MLIRVVYKNGKFDMVKPFILDGLISSGKLKNFFRSGGWIIIGVHSMRGTGGVYEGPERRKTFEYANVS